MIHWPLVRSCVDHRPRPATTASPSKRGQCSLGSRHIAPLRVEARRAAALRRENSPRRRRSLVDLAAEVHLSPSRLSSVFVAAYGKTPLAYLIMLRAERLAQLLRETDLTVTAAMQRVGWHSRSHATRLFSQYVGVTPGRCKRVGARTV